MDVSGPELATILNLTDRQVRNLADQGVVVKLEHGRYALAGSVQGYVAHKLKTELARVARTPAEDRVRDLRADEIELRIEKESGALIAEARAEGLAIVNEHAGKLRAGVLAVPVRLIADLALRRKVVDGLVVEFDIVARAAGAEGALPAPPPNRAARRAARHARPAH